MIRRTFSPTSTSAFALLFCCVLVFAGCVSKVPIRVAAAEKVGLASGLGIPRITGVQDLAAYAGRLASELNVVAESEVRAEISGLTKEDEKRILEIYNGAIMSAANETFSWPRPTLDANCQMPGLRYCMYVNSQMRLVWVTNTAGSGAGGGIGAWNVYVQTSASLIQMSDKKAVWRFSGVRDGKVTGSSEKNVKRPFVTLWEKLAKDGVGLMLADLEKTIQEREAAAALVE